MDKIDIVYTWVDGSSIEYKNEYKKYCNYFNKGGVIPFVDTLKYSLRSVQKYFSNYRNIYIVTMRPQKPKWLIENEHCRIIHHDEIIEKKYLPTFNSNTIESRLHKIPGLSAEFIYINDDFIIMKKTNIKHFKKKNKVLLFENIHYNTKFKKLKWFDFNSRIPKIIYTSKYHVDPHVPTLINKNCWEEMQQGKYKQDFETIMKSKCSRACDYPVIYYLKFMKEKNKCEIVSTYNYVMNHLQFDISDNKTTRILLKYASIFKPRFLTLNDPHKDESEDWNKLVIDWLNRDFSNKSLYEK
jgi:hypothetical protein